MKYQWHTETTHHVRKVLALILLLAMSTVSGVYGQPILVQPPDGGTGLSNPILLDWSSVSGASGYDYQVYEGSTLVTANSNGPITSSYVRVNLGFEKTYRWRTRARVLPQNNPWSDYWTFTTAAEPVPTGVTATATSDTSARVTWTNPSGTIDAIQIYDSDSGAAFQFGENVPANLNSAERTGLVADHNYCFKVRVQMHGQWSALSTDEGCVSLVPPPVPPPTGITATPTSQTSARVTWMNPSGTIDAIQIYDSDNGAAYQFGENVPPNLNSAERTGLVASDPYCFKVRVQIGGRWSALSDAACTTLPVTPAPTRVTATATSDTAHRWRG